MLPIIANNQALTMSSREIAELTGSEHSNTLKTIRNLVNKGVVFGNETQRLNEQNGQYYPEFELDYRNTMVVVSGYSAELRAAVVDRWLELESKQTPRLPQTFAEALQLAADQAKQLELQAPKVAFVDKLVEKGNLMTATQVAQKHGKSAKWLNAKLVEHDVYSKAVKRSKVFRQWFIDKGYGENKQSEAGFDQSLFTNAGEVWINELLIAHGYI